MLLESIVYNPLPRLLDFYGIPSLNALSDSEYRILYDELHDIACDMILKEYGRHADMGEADQLAREWLSIEPWQEYEE